MKRLNNFQFIICLLFYLFIHSLVANCLPTGPEVRREPNATSDETANGESTAGATPAAHRTDMTAKWVSERECADGLITHVEHNNVAVEEAAPNHYVQHDSLQFDVDCPVDGRRVKYTVELTDSRQPDGQYVRRRFGHYGKIGRIYREARLAFNVSEIVALTASARDYNLFHYNSQIYARQMFVHVIDQMCAKLGFPSDDPLSVVDRDGFGADLSAKLQTQHYCRQSLYTYRLDESLLFSKYCLIFLLLFIGLTILCINCYLKYKNKENNYHLLSDESGSESTASPTEPHDRPTDSYRPQHERRNGYHNISKPEVMDKAVITDREDVNEKQNLPMIKRNGFLKTSYKTFEIQSN